jgi:hypothetical protein
LTVPVKHSFAFLVQVAEIHGPGVDVDSAVVFVLFGVETHWVSSFGRRKIKGLTTSNTSTGRGLNKYHAFARDVGDARLF